MRDAEAALEDLRQYADRLDPLLGCEYERLATRSLELLKFKSYEIYDNKGTAYGLQKRNHIPRAPLHCRCIGHPHISEAAGSLPAISRTDDARSRSVILVLSS